MTSYEMQATGSHSKNEDTTVHVSGFYKCLVAMGAVQLFMGIAALALGIANAIVCGMLGSIGYGIWGSLIVSVPCFFCMLFTVAQQIQLVTRVY
jgi:hypothetical protein